MVRVSVIIPTYNRAHIVGEAIASVLAQTFGDFEVIVIDDGSSDDTSAVVGKCRDARVRYFRQPNRGLPGARNRGIAEARGDIVSFLDSDDLWKPEKLEREVRFFGACPETDAVFADAEEVFLDGGTVASVMRASPGMRAFLQRAPRDGGLVISQRAFYLMMLTEQPVKPSALALRRSTLEELGGFDERMRIMEDWELLLRLARKRGIGYINRALTVMRLSRDSLHLSDPQRTLDYGLAGMSRERKLLRAGDNEALAASAQGINWICTFVSYQHQGRGEARAAIRASLRGWLITREPWLLIRAASLLLPRGLRARAKARLSRGRGSAPEAAT